MTTAVINFLLQNGTAYSYLAVLMTRHAESNPHCYSLPLSTVRRATIANSRCYVLIQYCRQAGGCNMGKAASPSTALFGRFDRSEVRLVPHPP